VAGAAPGLMCGKKTPEIRRQRRCDWNEILAQAGLPMCVCYFVMAWVEVWRREFGSGC
jgi:hypothetical protein